MCWILKVQFSRILTPLPNRDIKDVKVDSFCLKDLFLFSGSEHITWSHRYLGYIQSLTSYLGQINSNVNRDKHHGCGCVLTLPHRPRTGESLVAEPLF